MHLALLLFFCGIVSWYEGLVFGLGVSFFVAVAYWFFGDSSGAFTKACVSKRYLVVVVLFFLLGFLRSMQVEQQVDRFLNLVKQDAAAVHTFTGAITTDPSLVSGFLKAKIDIVLDGGGRDASEVGQLTVMLPVYPEVWRGQEITVQGKVQIQDVYGQQELAMLKPKVLGVREGSGLLSTMARLRRFFVMQMQRLFPESVGGFLIGILAGGVRGLSVQVVTDFRRTGLTHIIAVSGSNVTILLQFLSVVLAFVPRKWKFVVLGFCVLLFIAFVGFAPSAVRAGWMGFLGLMSLSFGRTKYLSLMLLWSAFFMLVVDPSLLLNDRGFQLSFLATIGVSYFTPLVQVVFERIRFGRFEGSWGAKLLEVMAGTVAVYILTFPVMASFQAFPLIGVIANLIFVAVIPVAMLLGAVIFVLSILFFEFSYVLARVMSVFVGVYFAGIHVFSTLPYAVIAVSPMSKYAVAVYYALLVVWLKLMPRPEV